ncbi:universal stress protein [Blastococcus atacamensis]|uniref:universal stress protein n=1 Tax=Blastococcus atacamensis TaxID=2070508 RepID=UPI0013000F27|nr:universal stress protein [Blastococcus atacamensis]
MSEVRQRIVVGIDGSEGARGALTWALTQAAQRGADLEVLSAFPVDFYWVDPYLLDSGRIDAIRSQTEIRAQAMLDEVRQDPAIVALAGAAAVDVQILVVGGAPAAHLVQRSEDAALLVVGSRGRGGLRSTVAGSVALHCSAHAKCPVVVVHPTTAPAEEPARVVVGLDDSQPARAALAAAVEMAAPLGARVDAVVAYEAPNYWIDLYAVMPPPIGETQPHARARSESIVAEVVGAEALERGAVRVVAVEGHPGQVLVREAEGARLLVVGSRSRNQLEGVVLGTVALHCVMHAPCPVLVVPEPADRSPESTVQATAGAGLTVG